MYLNLLGLLALFLIVLTAFCSTPAPEEATPSEPPASKAPSPSAEDKVQILADAVNKTKIDEATVGDAEPTSEKPIVKPDKPPKVKGPNPALLDPLLTSEKAPDSFSVEFETTKGSFVVQVTREWSPRGADRFFNLVKIGYFKEIAFFRVIEGFMAQFGMHGDPNIGQKWSAASIQDDPMVKSNQRGYISFAKTNAPNSRSVQFFINFKDNGSLDAYGFSPFGLVSEGMEVIDSVYKGYGEGAPQGRGPSQGRIGSEGNKYLKAEFPKLDYINKATLLD